MQLSMCRGSQHKANTPITVNKLLAARNSFCISLDLRRSLILRVMSPSLSVMCRSIVPQDDASESNLPSSKTIGPSLIIGVVQSCDSYVTGDVFPE
uniref:Uncharacterized protein n=1 Tax=Ciona intestinalis TaxID=7719 RepID=F6WH09_CIOIN